MESIQLRDSDDFIKLGQALKAAGLVESGADAKQAIQDGKSQSMGKLIFAEEENFMMVIRWNMVIRK